MIDYQTILVRVFYFHFLSRPRDMLIIFRPICLPERVIKRLWKRRVVIAIFVDHFLRESSSRCSFVFKYGVHND